jgi:hypothetical protein
MVGKTHDSPEDVNLGQLAEEAGVGRSFGGELRKALKLADYVQVRR